MQLRGCSELPLIGYNFWRLLLQILPFSLGFGIARAGAILVSYDGYLRSDAGIIGESLSLVMGAIMFVTLIVSLGYRKTPTQTLIDIAAYVALAINVALTLTLALYPQMEAQYFVLHYAILVTQFMCSNWLMFYWMRRFVGVSARICLCFVFLAIICSEIITFSLSNLPHFSKYLACSATICCTYFLMNYVRGCVSTQLFPQEMGSYLNSTNTLANPAYLAAFSVGLILLAVPTGMARGFPDGLSIQFNFLTQLSYVALTIAISLAWLIYFALSNKARFGTGSWILAQLLLVCAVLSFLVYPDNLAIGAVFATTLNIYLLGILWYTEILIMSLGKYRPLYYYTAGWIAYMIPRAVGRIGTFELADKNFSSSTILIIMLIMALMSAQFVLGYLLNASLKVVDIMQRRCTDRVMSALYREGEKSDIQKTPDNLAYQKVDMLSGSTLLGLPQNFENNGELRRASMEQSVSQIGKTFQLSAREQEVLTLFALGYTQKHVAEVLGLSPATVHTHIKRCYEKTNFHSRQEVLSYIHEHVDETGVKR